MRGLGLTLGLPRLLARVAQALAFTLARLAQCLLGLAASLDGFLVLLVANDDRLERVGSGRGRR
jgi:hypothetical protein